MERLSIDKPNCDKFTTILDFDQRGSLFRCYYAVGEGVRGHVTKMDDAGARRRQVPHRRRTITGKQADQIIAYCALQGWLP